MTIIFTIACKKCKETLKIPVNRETLDSDAQKLQKAQDYFSKHAMQTGHHIIHKQEIVSRFRN